MLLLLNEETKKKQSADLQEHLVKALRNCSADGTCYQPTVASQPLFLMLSCTAMSREEMLATEFDRRGLGAEVRIKRPHMHPMLTCFQVHKNVIHLVAEALKDNLHAEGLVISACRIFSNLLSMTPGDK